MPSDLKEESKAKEDKGDQTELCRFQLLTASSAIIPSEACSWEKYVGEEKHFFYSGIADNEVASAVSYR